MKAESRRIDDRSVAILDELTVVEERKANAAFLALAWNCHDELVERMERARSIIDEARVWLGELATEEEMAQKRFAGVLGAMLDAFKVLYQHEKAEGGAE